MKKWLCVVLAILIPISMSGVGVEAKSPETTFKHKDRNGDGQLSLSEFVAKGKKKNKAVKKPGKKKAAKKNGKKGQKKNKNK